jgi:integrase
MLALNEQPCPPPSPGEPHGGCQGSARPQSDVGPFESWEEVENVAGRAGLYGPIIVWACATGMRPEEWAALRWGDIDLRAKTRRVSQVIVEGTVKRTGKTMARSELLLSLIQPWTFWR